MPNKIQINYIELPAANFDQVQSFYERAFGWEFVDYGAKYRAFNDGKLDGGFYASDLQASSKNGSALVVLYAKSLTLTRDRIRKCGGEISVDIFAFPGGRRFHFLDPHGNELAVWSDKP